MKTQILIFLSALTLAATLHAQVFDAAALAAARSAGASAAAGNQSFQVDAQGNPILGPDGAPQTQPNSPAALAESLRMFQGITGIQGVEQVASPSQVARTGTARVRLEQSFTFNCRLTPPGKTFAAGALAFQLTGCDMADGSASEVQRVNMRICDAPARAGTCGQPADFDKPVPLTNGQYSAFDDLSLGLGCNSVAECQVTVNGTYTIGGNDATLKAGAQDAGDTSNFVAGIREMITTGDYAGKMQEIGQPLAACAEANRNNTDGSVLGCDGETVLRVESPSNSCNTIRQCLKEAVSIQNFERTCERSFPMTERQTRLSYSKTLTCEVETFSDTRIASTDSCVTEDNLTPTLGYTLVGTTEQTCAPDEKSCLSKKHTDYWVDTLSVDTLSVSGNPAPVGGQCDTRPGSPSSFTSCDSWFGRTAGAASCTGLLIDEATGLASGGGINLNFNERAGCGFCVAPTVGQSCYATQTPTPQEIGNGAELPDTCASIDLSGCSFKSAQPMTFSSAGGLVMSQQEVYACRTESTQCVQWSSAGSDPSCLTQDLAMGVDKLANFRSGSSEALNAALIAAATLDATASGVERTNDSRIPKLFTGTDLRCNRPSGGFGSLLASNCCRTDLERPKAGNLIKRGCSMNEAKLAAARRSSYATYIGEYCSRKFLKKCLRTTQTYCIFEGILPRLVQEQGRRQLAQITSSSVSSEVQRAPMAFQYLDTGAGSWSTPVVANGVTLAAWQWPQYCETRERAYQQLLSDPESNFCAGVVSTWFAACDIPGGCGPLPDRPEEGSLSWSVSEVNPLEKKTSATSRFSVVSGACSTGTQSCNYEIAAWPVGTGGRAFVTRDLRWSLFGAPVEDAVGNPAPLEYQLSNIGDLMFKGYSLPGAVGGALPSTVRLDLSRDGGQAWTMFTVFTGQKSVEQSLAGDVKVIGGCDAATSLCEFRATGTTAVSAKPWGGARAPDCSGYTAGQLSVLDFSKMDLSEWLSTIMGKLGDGDTAGLREQATAQFATFNALFQQGKVRGTSPVSANFARAVPAEGFGPFAVKLAISGVWPEVTGDPVLDTDTVLSAQVDWGDCSPPETLLKLESGEGNGFRAVHRYLAPSDRDPATGTLAHSCLLAQPGDRLERNLVHEVKLTVRTLNSGVQIRSLSVENAWARFPGANSNNVNVGVEAVVSTPASQVPAAPRP